MAIPPCFCLIIIMKLEIVKIGKHMDCAVTPIDFRKKYYAGISM